MQHMQNLDVPLVSNRLKALCKVLDLPDPERTRVVKYPPIDDFHNSSAIGWEVKINGDRYGDRYTFSNLDEISSKELSIRATRWLAWASMTDQFDTDGYIRQALELHRRYPQHKTLLGKILHQELDRSVRSITRLLYKVFCE